MSPLAIIKPIPATITVSGGSNVANLSTDDPREIWVSNSATGGTISFDLGAIQEIDSFFLGFTNLLANGYMAISTGMTAHDETVATAGIYAQISTVEPDTRRHVFFLAPTTIWARYVKFTFVNPDGVIAAIQAGVAMVGKAFRPTYGREWGSGRPVIDTGSRERLIGGGFGIGQGVRKTGYQWTMGDLSDAEVQDLFRLAMNRGETRGLLFVEDPTFTAPANATAFVSDGTMSFSIVGSGPYYDFTKIGGASSYGGTAYTADGFTDGVHLRFNPVTATGIALGFSSDPLSAGWSTIDYAIRLATGGGGDMRNNGTWFGNLTWLSNDLFEMTYEGGNLRIWKNGALVNTQAIGAGRRFWFDSNFSTGDSANNVLFHGADGFAEKLHWGVFDRIEPYERSYPGGTRWGLRIEDWI